MKPKTGAASRHPQEEANFLSRLMLWWIIPLLWKGWRRQLQQDDLHQVRDKDRSRKLSGCLEEKWKEEVYSAKRGIISVITVLIEVFIPVVLNFGLDS